MLGRRFICLIGPATEREFILDWRIFRLDWLSCLASNLKQLPRFWMFWFFWIRIFNLIAFNFLAYLLYTTDVSRQHQMNSSKPTFTKWLAAELCCWYCTHLASHWVIKVIISNYGLISKKCCSLKYFERLHSFFCY